MPATTRHGPRTPVWAELTAHAARLAAVPVQELFERDPGRFERLSREHAGLLLDFSRQRLDEIALAKLFQLADVTGLRARIEAMWQGAHINTTEDRAVLHVALRQPRGAGVGGADIEQSVMAERARVLKFAQGVREGAIRGSAREPFKLVVNIGIGGSDLGPAMAVQALSAFAIGERNFLEFLHGGHEMDEHFRTAPWAENLPALMGLVAIWNINFMNLPTLAVLPYDDSLRRFPAYLQQLEMESNGKSVTLDGKPVEWQTAAVIWGEPGNNAQHSFFQLLHQGTLRAALDFLLPVRSSCGNQAQQDLAIASCLAQAEAFMTGQSAATVRAELQRQEMPPAQLEHLIPHKVHSGSRPSSIVLFPMIAPTTLCTLIVLSEYCDALAPAPVPELPPACIVDGSVALHWACRRAELRQFH